MNIYIQVISQIIKQQEMIIGSLALNQARNVSGLNVVNDEDISLKGDGKIVLGDLVKQYEQLFGQASVEVCKDVIRETKPPIPLEQLPEILR